EGRRASKGTRTQSAAACSIQRRATSAPAAARGVHAGLSPLSRGRTHDGLEPRLVAEAGKVRVSRGTGTQVGAHRPGFLEQVQRFPESILPSAYAGQVVQRGAEDQG